jgi:hypothetical protein
MAKKQAAETGEVKARVLVDCSHGKVNDVVTFRSATEAQAAGPEVDTDPAAVEYAESLKSANA